MKQKNAADGKPRLFSFKRPLFAGLLTVGFMAALLIVGLRPNTAAAPQAAPVQDVSPVDADAAARLNADCTLIQHIVFQRCGHDMTRRQVLPAELAGKTKAELEAAYDLWQVTSFAAGEVSMEQNAPLFCAEHVVLLPDESGVLCVFENRYGDAYALLESLDTPLSSLPEGKQEEVRAGKGFDSREELGAWLESAES